ncbi:hemagglutinin repeat-containing protein [Lelliottia amnigena]|uniref:hemagglutinin repeat-containing protein n=1 Tax=Lelliottia amnigena TaxID=61646 RepID=UPI002B23ABD9|nr:hemagglutinin repeat-containing protein [Lelliottia amnigena]MEA9395894.1 hemagglutinin repeat-containing protein [Lelliottia amnigena]
MATRHPPVRFSQRLISWVVCGVMIWQPMAPAFAAVMTPTGNTTMDKAGNGVPVVNIATPNGAGISHNQFNSYNVGKEGVILNNATDRLTATQLGGLIQNNPNLQAGREAKGIINEVTGGSRSQLQGYTEVGGKAANVMVANPYGITCNGCGFINTPNVTLTTGKPQFDASGNLMALDVTKGAITVEGQGLDASKSDALSIISRATEVNAAIHANDLSVTAGANRVSADGSVKAIAGQGATPTVAVDTGALGGMYANRIRLVSSDKGVGVNLGNLNARQGDIQLDASGKLTVANSLASGTLTAKGAGVTLNGSQQAGGALNVASTQDMTLNNASLTSGGEMRLTSDGKLQATGGGATSKGALTVNSSQDMALTNARLVGQGNTTLSSNGKLNINGGGVSGNGAALAVSSQKEMTLTNTTLVGQGKTTLAAGDNLTVNGGSLSSRGELSATSGQGMTVANAAVGSDASTTLTSGGTLTVNAGSLSAGKDLTLKGQQLVLDNRNRADASGNVRLEGESLTNQGQINAAGDLAISGNSVDNSGQMAAKGRVDAQTRALNNSGSLQGNGVTLQGQTLTNKGTLQSGGLLAINAGTLNQQGMLSAKGDVDLNVSETLQNSGDLLADGGLTVKTGALTQNGVLSGAKALSANADSLTSGKGSRTTSQGNIQLTAAQLADLNGQTDAAGALNVSAKNLKTRADAHLQSGQDLTLQAQNVTLNGIQAVKGALNVTAQTLDHDGQSTAKTLTFSATEGITSGGEFTADSISLHGQRITHSGIAKAKNITFTAPEFITSSGTLVADGLTLDGQRITNSGLLQANTQFNLHADALDNLASGALYSVRDLTLDLPELTNQGLITTDGNLWLKGNALTNAGEINGVNLRLDNASLANQTAGRLLADDQLNVTGTALVNDGQMAANTLQLTADSLQNHGVMQGDKALTLNAAEIHNSGALRSDGTLDLRGASFENAGELSATDLLFTLTRQMNNRADGKIIAKKGLTLTAPELLNSGLLAGANTQLNAGAILNSGTLQGTNVLTATGKRLENQQAGKLLSGGELHLQNATLTNAGLLQGKTLNLATGEWINSGNALGEAGVTATVSGSFSNHGNVLSQQQLDLNATNITNQGQLLAKVLTLHGDLLNSGLLQGSDALAWTGDQFTNQAQGQVTGGETLTLSGTSLKNQGQIQSRDAALTADTLTNSGSVQALDRLKLNVDGRLDNQGAMLSQNLFELTAAQLFNDGQLAAKSLTLNTPQLTNTGTVQGNDSLTLTTRNLTNAQSGQLVSGGALDLDLDKLDNAGLMQVNQRFTLKGSDLLNRGDIQADALDFALSKTLNNQGGIVSKNGATLNAPTLTNSGTLAGKNLTLSGTDIRNSGLVQGNDNADATASRITNDAAGKWISGGALTLNGGQLTNAGAVQGATIGLTATSLDNGGTLNGLNGFTGTFSGKLTNSGQIQSGGALNFSADSILNPGRMTGKTLALNAHDLNNSGLWQGTDGLTLTGDTLATTATSRTLTGGTLTLGAGQLTTQGTLQGNSVDVTSDGWTHGGTLLSLGGLTANVGGTLTSTGSLMSKGAADVTAQTLDNRGQLLGEGDVTLGGAMLKNSGTVQGKNLALHQTSINNQGTLTGLDSLTIDARQQLMARMAMAAPQQELINGASGALLTQGTLNITSGAVTNAGSWQGQNILLNAQSLTNSGAVQSADALQMTLANTLTSSAGSKITAMGTATLQALSLSNQGQWAAKNLTLKGTTLSNSGAISGVNGLTLAQTGAVTQQQSGTMLSAGALNVNAQSVNNDGKIQGATLGVTTGALTNNGRLQGDNGVTLGLSGNLTNNAGGEIVSRQALTVTTPSLFNYGLIQGGGETSVTATSQARNDGKLLSGARLTLTTPQYTGAGWLQATNLILNAATATNSGTWVADRATLTGNTLTHQGATQAGTLAVNYTQLTNSGTLLGNTQLTIDADQVNQNAAGKLFSGGDLWLDSKGLDVVGQVVSLGNLTLKLTNAFTSKTALAAGKTLAISSNGAIDNRSVMQGQAVNLTAGGQLTNNGQITTGTGASTLSGSTVALNGAGTIQGGGDINIASRGNITVDGFTGTRGSLTLSAPGSIINTALLYAANNLALYANIITNQRGDILAGNNLWMQKDAAGNANSQVTNTSGNIETTRGDITIRTAQLLNEREGLNVSSYEKEYPDAIPFNSKYLYGLYYGHKTPDFEISLEEWKHNADKVVYDTWEHCTGGGINEHCSTRIDYRLSGEDIRQFLLSESVVQVSATGGAARIAAGRDLTVIAGKLDNRASNILAGRNITLSGGTLNNLSAEGGRKVEYVQAEYHCEWFYSDCGSSEWIPLEKLNENTWYWRDKDELEHRSWVPYILGERTTEFTPDGGAYRAVIQAGGNVTANFSSNISNTNTTANAGGVSNTISAPSLNTLSNKAIGSGAQKQSLANTGTVAVNSPEWNDQLQGALQQINGGGALDSNGASNAALTNISTSQKGNANLGKLGSLANAGVTTAALNSATGGATGQYQGKTVDTSAYPLPSGNNGYFVISDNPKSPYLINVNPKLNDLGKLDPALFTDLNALLGVKPSTAAPQETRTAYTDEKQVLGSSYMLGRLNLNPDYDYRFLGDAAFDTRYVSNTVLNQTGNRYLNGIGSDLDQMRYLMDNAAAQQQALGLQFGVSLNADQIAALDHSIIWWEKATINGETVMVPKVYLSPKDVTVNNGSVIAGNNVTLKSGNITNSGSSLLANNSLTIDSQNSISNLNDGLMKAGGALNLSAIGDINNISSTISGKTVALESLDGSINNLTLADQIDINAKGKRNNVTIKDTVLGSTASITAQDSLSLEAGKNITVTGANLASGGDMLLNAWGDIAVNANQVNDAYGSSQAKTSRSSVTYQGSSVSAGGDLIVNAGHNIDLTASDVKAGGSAGLSAGNDLNLNAAQTSENSRNGKSESHSTDVDRTTISAGENLVLKAGQDINAQAAALAAEKNVGLQAGRDVNLAARETREGDSYKSSKKTVINESVRQQGTEIASGGNTAIIAGRDVNAQATQVLATKDVGIAAGHNINLSTATESDYAYKETLKTKKGFLSKKTTHKIHEESATHEKGSLLSGDNVTLQAGTDLNLLGSAVAADGDIALNAGNNVTVEAAENTASHYDKKSTKKSGVFGGGSLGITIGSQSSKSERKGVEVTESDSRSVIGTTGGNVVINAGKQVTLSATDVVAGRMKGDTDRKTGHIDITGSDIAIVPGRDQITQDAKQSSKSSGLTVSVADPLINGIRNIRDIAHSDSDSITKVKQLSNEIAATGADMAMGSSLPMTYGKSSSNSESHYEGLFNTGSALNAAGNVQLTATGKNGQGDILIRGSQVSAGEAVIMDAKRDIAIVTSTDSEHLSSKANSKGWSITDGIAGPGAASRALNGSPDNGNKILPYAMDNSRSQSDRRTTTENASHISGADIYINSRNGSVDIAGSALGAINDLLIAADKGNINVTTGNNATHQSQSGSHSMVGNLGGDGYSGTIGWRKDTFGSTSDGNEQNTLRTQIASQKGNVSLQAGEDVSVHGADISAGNTLVVSGKNVLFDVSEDRLKNHSDSSSTQYGIKGQVSGWAVSAAQTAERVARSVQDDRDPRLTGIYAAQAGLDAATQTMQGDMNPAAFKVSVSATAGKTSQTQDYSHSQQQGSTLHAGNAVIIKAREDIAGKGVDISGKTVTLNAGRDIVLSSSRDTETLKNSASGNSVSAGVGFSMGGSQNGFTGEFGYSQNQSRADGKSQTNQNSKVHADNILNIISGRDTTLNGAELSADKVIADVGRDLTIASVQDTSRYDSKSTSSGVNLSVCIPPICYGAVVQGSGSMDSQKLHNNYDSVKDQSGIYAGKDGFDISVGNHTQLDGAVIASDATADKNHLDTGTLGWKNLHNQSDWSGKQAGFTVSAGIGFNNDTQSNEPTSQGQPSTSLASVSGSESGITHSAVANGTITIRDKANQKQDVANLSRDTANANHSVKDSFDADKVKDKLEIQTAATSLGIQAANAYKAAMEEQAASQNATLKEELHQQNPQATEAELNAAVKNDSRYINADKEYGPGSDFWRATSGATGLIAGILGGNIQGGVAAGAAPYMAKLVKDATGENEAARIALHGIVSAALAEVQGGNGLAAAAGGMASAALMGNTLAKAFYGKDVKDLDGEQRAFISNLATAVGAAAGGSVGGDTFSAASGANAARVEVENNALGPNSFGKGMADMGLSQQSLAASMIQNGATADELTEALIKNSQGQIPEGQDAVKGLLTAWGEFFGFRSVR